MRTCPKCKRANDVTRKFCTRCGASLLISLDEPPSVEKSPAPQIDEVKAEPEETYAAPTESAIATTEDSSVQPSEVDRERLRTTVPKEKTEMEKAMEAFSKADEVGIEEADSGIVEVRTLRASEVHELMDETITETPPVETAPSEPAPAVLPSITEPPPSPMIESSQVRPDIREEPETKREPPPKLSPERIVEPEPQIPKVEPKPSPPISSPITTSTDASLVKPLPEVDAVLAKIPEYLTDGKIKELTTDLTHLHMELKQVKVDLESTSGHLNEEARNYRNNAEIKRIHFESLDEQLRLAKQEWNDAQKEFERADNRREKEIGMRNKRIKDIEKRISKTESAVEKRARELQKEKERLAKQADMKTTDN